MKLFLVAVLLCGACASSTISPPHAVAPEEWYEIVSFFGSRQSRDDILGVADILEQADVPYEFHIHGIGYICVPGAFIDTARAEIHSQRMLRDLLMPSPQPTGRKFDRNQWEATGQHLDVDVKQWRRDRRTS